jgi:hypothetical protein
MKTPQKCLISAYFNFNNPVFILSMKDTNDIFCKNRVKKNFCFFSFLSWTPPLWEKDALGIS